MHWAKFWRFFSQTHLVTLLGWKIFPARIFNLSSQQQQQQLMPRKLFISLRSSDALFSKLFLDVEVFKYFKY
jgi:hypothetical protein